MDRPRTRVPEPSRRLLPSRVAAAVSLAVILLALGSPTAADDAKPSLVRGPVISIDKDGNPTVELVVQGDAPDLALAASWTDGSKKTETVKLEKTEGGKAGGAFPKGIPGSATVDYEVRSGKNVLASRQARTLPRQGAKKLAFCAVGDSGYPRRGRFVATEEQLSVAKLLAKLDPDLVLHTGDVVYPVGQEKGLDPLFFQPYAATLARVPFFCCLGNHDVATKNGDPELRLFPHPPNDHENRYFSFDAASVHFVCLDANEPDALKDPATFAETEQGKWLKADLAASDADWKIAYFHQPLYSCFASREKERERLRTALEKLLHEGGVDLAVCGHDHFYHRSERLLRGAKDGDGIVHIVTGGGGADLYGGKPVDGITASYKECYHLTRFVVDGAKLELEALAPRESGEPESIDKATFRARKAR